MRRSGVVVLVSLLFFSGWGIIRAMAAPAGECDVCVRAVRSGSAAVLNLSSGETLELCCSRCALTHQRRNDVEADRLTLRDASGGQPVAAEEAFFVEGGRTPACCASALVRRDGRGAVAVANWDRCRPSLHAFADRRRAQEFARRHGGTVAGWQQLRPARSIN